MCIWNSPKQRFTVYNGQEWSHNGIPSGLKTAVVAYINQFDLSVLFLIKYLIVSNTLDVFVPKFANIINYTITGK